jgi:hypothetical protein
MAIPLTVAIVPEGVGSQTCWHFASNIPDVEKVFHWTVIKSAGKWNVYQFVSELHDLCFIEAGLSMGQAWIVIKQETRRQFEYWKAVGEWL